MMGSIVPKFGHQFNKVVGINLEAIPIVVHWVTFDALGNKKVIHPRCLPHEKRIGKAGHNGTDFFIITTCPLFMMMEWRGNFRVRKSRGESNRKKALCDLVSLKLRFPYIIIAELRGERILKRGNLCPHVN